jgi:PKD repeat protein
MVGESILLDGSGSNDLDGTIVSYEWDLDDDGFYDDATGVTTTNSWSSEGTYTISLKVTDDGGLTDTDDAIVNIGSHAVDGIISPGEYDCGMAVELVKDLWTVDALIDWDDQYLYVAVDEPCPTYIEFAFDAGPHRDRWDVFTLFGSGSTNHQICLKASGGWSGDPYVFDAFSDTATEFKVDYTDFGIESCDTIKMCIERGSTPNAYWPEGGNIWQAPGRRPDPCTWGDVTLCPCIVCVTIDIKPGSCPNSINPRSKGKIPVAILTTCDFDASMVDPDTVVFLSASPVHWAMEDVDHDGDADMILHFKTQECDFSLLVDEGGEYPYAYLTGETNDGQLFEGKDTVRLVHPLQIWLEQIYQQYMELIEWLKQLF